MLHRLLLKIGFLPPLLNIWLVLLGLILLPRYKKFGILLCPTGLGSLYLLSTPQVADRMLASIEVAPVFSADRLMESDSAAIVVLGAGHSEYRREYEGGWPDINATARLNYAARLHRQTQLPVLLSGGSFADNTLVHADVMRDYLRKQYFIRAQWLERESRTTEKNARYSVAMLKKEGIDTVVLVTQSAHMRRSLLLFERVAALVGIKVIPAPTEFAEGVGSGIRGWLPSAEHLALSRLVIHEMLGYAWYRWVARD